MKKNPIHLIIGIIAINCAFSGMIIQAAEIKEIEFTYKRKAGNFIISKFSTIPDMPRYPKGYPNTGLAYDPVKHRLVLSHANSFEPKECLEFFDKQTGKVCDTPVQVNVFLKHLQGVTYDTSDNTFWVWGGMKKNPETRWIFHCDATGKKLDDSFEFNKYPGMLAYDEKLDCIWARPNGSRDVYRLCCKTGKLLETWNMKITGGESIAIDPYDRTFWVGNTTDIYHIRKSGKNAEIIEKYPNPTASFPDDAAYMTVVGKDISFSADKASGGGIIRKTSGGLKKPHPIICRKKVIVMGSEKNDGLYKIVSYDDKQIIVKKTLQDEPEGREITIQGYIRGEDEGLVVDPQDRTLWYNSDQYTHGLIPKGNRCWHLDPLGTFNRKFFFPGTIPWDEGLLKNLVRVNKALSLKKGVKKGTFISPVIDLADRTCFKPKVSANSSSKFTIQYRSSDTSPTISSKKVLNLKYYPATEENQGWGTTSPGPWAQKPGNKRFLQIMIEISSK